ncbi:MAG: hypothetical protein ABI885_07885 [Gammaproteobacteria bacterium]
MSYPPHLLDELARVFARVALDRLLKESAARPPRQEGAGSDAERASPPRKDDNVADGDAGG